MCCCCSCFCLELKWSAMVHWMYDVLSFYAIQIHLHRQTCIALSLHKIPLFWAVAHKSNSWKWVGTHTHTHLNLHTRVKYDNLEKFQFHWENLKYCLMYLYVCKPRSVRMARCRCYCNQNFKTLRIFIFSIQSISFHFFLFRIRTGYWTLF